MYLPRSPPFPTSGRLLAGDRRAGEAHHFADQVQPIERALSDIAISALEQRSLLQILIRRGEHQYRDGLIARLAADLVERFKTVGHAAVDDHQAWTLKADSLEDFF